MKSLMKSGIRSAVSTRTVLQMLRCVRLCAVAILSISTGIQGTADSADHYENARALPSSPDPDWLPPEPEHPFCACDRALVARVLGLPNPSATSVVAPRAVAYFVQKQYRVVRVHAL